MYLKARTFGVHLASI